MLVNAGVYKNGIRQDSNLRDLSDFVLPTHEDEFAWLALKDPSEVELMALGKKLSIPDLVLEDILHGNQQPKMEEYDAGQIFVTMKQYFWGGEELLEGEVALLVAPSYAVSVRRGGGGDFAKVRQRAQEEKELLAHGTGFVLYAILDIVVDRYFPVIVEFERRIDILEDKMFSSLNATPLDRKKMAQDLHAIRRDLGRFKQGVEPMLEATIKFFGGRVPKICNHLGEYFRDVHDHLSRIVSACERMRDDAAGATQTNLALVTIEESEITKKLASYAAIFAVVTLMAGIWGMNFDSMPELKWKYGYLFALSCMTIVSLILWRKFKKAGWL